MIENLTRFGMHGGRIPNRRDHINETRKLEPKVFQLESPRPLRATIIGEKKGAMVRKRREKGVEDMISKAEIPILIAIASIKLA
jgi:hypothetical protein